MSLNPYQPPAAESNSATPPKFKRTLVAGIITATSAFALLVVLAILKPIHTGEVEPPQVAMTRRAIAGLMLTLWAVTFAGLAVATISGIAWMTRGLDK